MSKNDKKLDWLGKEYGPGDIVLYARGRSMGMGEVVRFTERGNVTIRPMRNSYGGSNTRIIRIDRRNGYRVGYWNREHWERDSGYLHKVTGDFYTYEEKQKLLYPDGQSWRSPRNPEESNFTYVSHTYKPYVIEVEVMAFPVTIFNTNQIMKWEGPVQDGETKQVS